MTQSSNLLRAAFLADSLGLGSHWVYDQAALAQRYPQGTLTLDDPQSSYHPNRRRGQFTHFGDQMLLLLRALASTQNWSLSHFAEVWQTAMSSYDGYLDGATKETLKKMAQGAPHPGSSSNDLSGAARPFRSPSFPSMPILSQRPLESKRHSHTPLSPYSILLNS